jgi:hypothetical protein
MCERGKTVSVPIWVRLHPEDPTNTSLEIGEVSVDSCIARIVEALNKACIRTVASCCGHGIRPGNIALADGRELIIAPDYETARRVDKAFPSLTNCGAMDTEDMVERLARIQERADAATKGPWIQDPDTAVGKVWVKRGMWGHIEPLFRVHDDYRRGEGVRRAARDAAFVVHAREDVPWLCAEVVALRAENERLKATAPRSAVDQWDRGYAQCMHDFEIPGPDGNIPGDARRE